MKPMSLFWVYTIALMIFLAIDALWLSTVGKTFYTGEIGQLLLDRPRLEYALMFYLLFIAGLMVFVLRPSLAANSMAEALLLGGFYGLVCYATYDLTNFATLKGYTLRLAVIDMIWGASLSASVSGLTLFAARVLKLV
jgi:uncharacterized membrane protein